MLLNLVLLAQISGAAPASRCEAPTAPALDHAIIAVRDVDRAVAAFRSAGFVVKIGRLHPNGLLNRHVKFKDGTEIELMTVRGTAGDDMARRYAGLIAAGDGGVYVALKARELATAERHAETLRLPTRRTSSGPWQFLSFADASPAAAVFFTAGEATVADADSIFRHEPPVEEFAEVWLEGGPELGQLLSRLGSVPCDEVMGKDGRTGRRWALRRGSVVIVPPRGNARPRVLGAVLEIAGTHSRTTQPLPQFWIQYR